MAFNFKHNNERLLYQGFVQESTNIFGIDMEYWIVAMDSTKDPLYGEDTNPDIIQKFDIKGYGSLINEVFMLDKFGFNSPDMMEIKISKEEFIERVGDPLAIPKSGDYVYINFLERVFILTDAQDDDNIFQQKKFSWKLFLKAAPMTGGTASLSISGGDLAISDWPSGSPDEDDTLTISEEASGVLVNKELDPFGDWG